MTQKSQHFWTLENQLVILKIKKGIDSSPVLTISKGHQIVDENFLLIVIFQQ